MSGASNLSGFTSLEASCMDLSNAFNPGSHKKI